MNPLGQLCFQNKYCARCNLHESRNFVVFGEGNPKAEILIIGEGPGKNEDLSGRPFVGAAGNILDAGLKTIGLQRKDVYITNIVRCRPPQNRKPAKDEIKECLFWLEHQVDIIQPKVILALGATSANTILDNDLAMKDMVGKVSSAKLGTYYYNVFVNYHPASLLYDKHKVEIFYEYMNTFLDFFNEVK